MHFSGWEKFGFGILIAAWVAFGANFVGNTVFKTKPLAVSAYMVIDKTTSDISASKKESAAVNVESALTLLASADLGKGKKVFKKCASCHSSAEGAKHKVGPNLWDVVGRAKASAKGYVFSSALKYKGGDWSFADLDQFLISPKSYVKGTKMSFSGLKKAGDRAAVIAYLRTLSISPKPLP